MDEPPIARLLPHLERVKQTSGDSWIASCCGPLHANGDRKPSLTIKETPDSTLLMHCYSGCETAEILTAIGLGMSDLYPANADSRPPLSPRQRKRYGQALEALRAIRTELLIVLIAAERIGSGQKIDAEELARVRVARHRIECAVELAA